MSKKAIIPAFIIVFVAFLSSSGLAGGKHHSKTSKGFHSRVRCDFTVTCPDYIQPEQ